MPTLFSQSCQKHMMEKTRAFLTNIAGKIGYLLAEN
jgi:hypothetical protein